MRSLEAAMRRVRRAGADAVRFGLALFVAVAPAGAGGRPTEIITSQSPTGAADRQALLGAVGLLPRVPQRIVVMDVMENRPFVRDQLLKLDAFIVTGNSAIYVVAQSELLRGARGGSVLHRAMLAAVLWHEMAHLAGADEREAREAEEKLWTRFVRDGLCDTITGLRYLRALTTRPNDQLLRSTDVEDHTSSLVAPNSGFHCNTGYSVRDCDAQLTRRRDVLAGLELTPLGDWTWILVRSDDWKPILRRVGRDPDSPAFTILEKRQTFLDESLFSPTPDRSRTLLEKWRIPLDQLLAFAVSHELGHALCHERNEMRANAYAAQLRSTGRATCN